MLHSIILMVKKYAVEHSQAHHVDTSETPLLRRRASTALVCDRGCQTAAIFTGGSANGAGARLRLVESGGRLKRVLHEVNQTELINHL